MIDVFPTDGENETAVVTIHCRNDTGDETAAVEVAADGATMTHEGTRDYVAFRYDNVVVNRVSANMTADVTIGQIRTAIRRAAHHNEAVTLHPDGTEEPIDTDEMFDRYGY